MDKAKVKRILWTTVKITWIPAFFLVAVILGLIVGYGLIMAHSVGQHRSIPTVLRMGKEILNSQIWSSFIKQIADLR